MSLESYFEKAQAVLDAIRREETAALREAARLFAAALDADRLIYTFGTGHSSLLAGEGLYRAGGLAAVSAILEPTTTFAPGALAGSRLERLSGVAGLILDRYPLAEGDVLVVFSNSGVNAVPVEVAGEARRRGATVVAVGSREYAARAPVTSGDGERLFDVAHLVVDNHVPPGDAVVPFGDGGAQAASVSTVAGAFIWNALVAETVALLDGAGKAVPVYVSANMPGAGEHNRGLVERYRARVRHL